MAVPKSKVSKQRRNKRRSSVWKLETPGVTTCPKCGGEMYQRDDDKPETIKNRLDVYEKSTSPLVDYYRGQGLLKSVNGDQARETVYGDVKEALGL